MLSDTRRPLLPLRTQSEVEGSLPDCLFEDEILPYHEDDEEEEYYADKNAWLSKQDLKPKLPDAKEKYNGDLDVMKIPTVSLKGSTIQCIIKFADIVLTPEKPEYLGGKWHVEGKRVTVFIPLGCNGSLTLLRNGKRTYRFQFHIRKSFIQPPPRDSILISFEVLRLREHHSIETGVQKINVRARISRTG